jgi:hypothetical protein
MGYLSGNGIGSLNGITAQGAVDVDCEDCGQPPPAENDREVFWI